MAAPPGQNLQDAIGMQVHVQLPPGHILINSPQGLVVIDQSTGRQAGFLSLEQLFSGVHMMPQAQQLPAMQQFQSQHQHNVQQRNVAVPLPQNIPVIPLASASNFPAIVNAGMGGGQYFQQQRPAMFAPPDQRRVSNATKPPGGWPVQPPVQQQLGFVGRAPIPNGYPPVMPFGNTNTGWGPNNPASIGDPGLHAVQPAPLQVHAPVWTPSTSLSHAVTGPSTVPSQDAEKGAGASTSAGTLEEHNGVSMAAPLEPLSKTVLRAVPRVLDAQLSPSGSSSSASLPCMLISRLCVDLQLEADGQTWTEGAEKELESANRMGNALLQSCTFALVGRVMRPNAPPLTLPDAGTVQPAMMTGLAAGRGQQPGSGNAKGRDHKQNRRGESNDPITLTNQACAAWCAAAMADNTSVHCTEGQSVQDWKPLGALSIKNEPSDVGGVIASTSQPVVARRGMRLDVVLLAFPPREGEGDKKEESSSTVIVRPIEGSCLAVAVMCIEPAPVEPGVVPDLSVVKAAKTSLKLKWGVAEDGGDESIRYELQASEQSDASVATWDDIYSGPERTYEHKRLQPGCRYTYRARACNVAGAGPWSPLLVRETESSVPLPPHVPTCADSLADRLILSWPAITFPGNGGSAVTEYALEMAVGAPPAAFVAHQQARAGGVHEEGESGEGTSARAGKSRVPPHGLDFSVLYRGSAISHSAAGLLAEQEYSFRLVACNKVGASMPSPIATFRTSTAPPSIPGRPFLQRAASVTDAGPTAPYAWQMHELLGTAVAVPGRVCIQWQHAATAARSTAACDYVVEYVQLALEAKSMSGRASGKPQSDISMIGKFRAAQDGRGKKGSGKHVPLAVVRVGLPTSVQAGSSCSVLLPDLPTSSAWQVRVAAKTHAMQSAWSPCFEFVTGPVLPGIPTFLEAHLTPPMPHTPSALVHPYSTVYPALCGAKMRVQPPADGGAQIGTYTLQVRHVSHDIASIDALAPIPSPDNDSHMPLSVPERTPCHPGLYGARDEQNSEGVDVPFALHAPRGDTVPRLLVLLAKAAETSDVIDASNPANDAVTEKESDSSPALTFEPGTAVDAVYTVDGQWYRGTVVGLVEESIVVSLDAFGLDIVAQPGGLRCCFVPGVAVTVLGAHSAWPAALHATVVSVTSDGYAVQLAGNATVLDVPAGQVNEASDASVSRTVPAVAPASSHPGKSSWAGAVMSQSKQAAKPLVVVTRPNKDTVPASIALPDAEEDNSADAISVTQALPKGPFSHLNAQPQWYQNVLRLHLKRNALPELDYSVDNWGDAMLDCEPEEVQTLQHRGKQTATSHRQATTADTTGNESWVQLARLSAGSLSGLTMDPRYDLPSIEINLAPTCLLPGHTYEMRMRVTTAVGDSDWSATVVAVAPAGPPTPLIAPGVQLARVKSGHQASDELVHLSFEDVSLHSADSLQAAVNAAPVASSPTSISLCLSAPQDFGCSPADSTSLDVGFLVEYAGVETERSEPLSGWRRGCRGKLDRMEGDGGTVVTLTGLHPGRAYWVRAAACSSAGQSAWTVPVLVRTQARPPLPPTGFTAALRPTVSALRNVLQAGVPSHAAGALRLDEKNGTILLIALTGVAMSSYRRGGRLADKHLALPGGPEQYPDPEPANLSMQWPCVIDLSWNPPEDERGSPTQGYAVSLGYSSPDKQEQDMSILRVTGDGQLLVEARPFVAANVPPRCIVYSGVSPCAVIAALSPGCVYHARVQAINSAGAGAWSHEISVPAPVDIPAAPIAPTSSSAAISSTGMRVSWSIPSPMATGLGMLVAYHVNRGRVVVAEDSNVIGNDADALAAALNSGDRSVQLVDVRNDRVKSEIGTGMRMSSLLAGTAYAVRLAVESEMGAGAYGPFAVFITKAQGGPAARPALVEVAPVDIVGAGEGLGIRTDIQDSQDVAGQANVTKAVADGPGSVDVELSSPMVLPPSSEPGPVHDSPQARNRKKGSAGVADDMKSNDTSRHVSPGPQQIVAVRASQSSETAVPNHSAKRGGARGKHQPQMEANERANGAQTAAPVKGIMARLCSRASLAYLLLFALVLCGAIAVVWAVAAASAGAGKGVARGSGPSSPPRYGSAKGPNSITSDSQEPTVGGSAKVERTRRAPRKARDTQTAHERQL